MNKKWISILSVVGFGLIVRADVLFMDTFDRGDNTDINVGASVDQSGSFSPAVYTTVSSDAQGGSSIAGQVLQSTVGSGGITRVVPQFNISSLGEPIVAAGGFSVSYTVDAGVDYEGAVHGSYSHSLILSKESVAENTSAGSGSTFQGLVTKIAGNGQVRVFNQGSELFNLANSAYGNAYVVGAENAIRIDVETDGFLTTSANVFTLYINDVEVCSNAFAWRHNSDLSLAFEADSYSSEFDDLQVQTIPEPTSLGLIAVAGVTVVFLRRKMVR